jgi:hypothetical protein
MKKRRQTARYLLRLKEALRKSLKWITSRGDPSIPGDPDAVTYAPLKPRPRPRSGAMAVPEPELEDAFVSVRPRISK